MRVSYLTRAALASGVLALLTMVVFWSGAPVVPSSGTATVGWRGRLTRRGAYQIALGLGILAFVGGWVLTALNLTGLDLF